MKKQKLNYYDEFISNVNLAFESSKILDEYVKNFNGDLSEEKENKVHSLEIDADRGLHNLLNYLIRDFVPPFDREDIIMLSHAIDDLEDCIDEVVININIFNIKKLRSDMSEFTELIVNSCEILKELFVKFKESKKHEDVHEMIIEVNRLEESGDKLYQKAIKGLFEMQVDSMDLVRWKTLYDCLEDCLDHAETVANNVEGIIMKKG